MTTKLTPKQFAKLTPKQKALYAALSEKLADAKAAERLAENDCVAAEKAVSAAEKVAFKAERVMDRASDKAWSARDRLEKFCWDRTYAEPVPRRGKVGGSMKKGGKVGKWGKGGGKKGR